MQIIAANMQQQQKIYNILPRDMHHKDAFIKSSQL